MARRNEVAIILTALDAASRTLDGVRQSVNDLDTTGSRAERGGVAGIGRDRGGLINPATLAVAPLVGTLRTLEHPVQAD